MTEKTKVGNLINLHTQLLSENGGLTYKQMMEDYGLTRWGARKIGDHPDTNESRGDDYEKIISTEEKTDSLANMTVPLQSDEVDHEEETRNTQDAKQTITKKAGTYLAQLEEQVKNSDTPDTGYEEPEYKEKGFTAVIHETDSHFSARVKNRHGEVVYDTERAAQATREAFIWYANKIISKRAGRTLDEIVLLFGGDILEGEGIYETQPHHIDDTLEDQITKARKTYYDVIRNLKTTFEVPMKIVCVSGNHGDLKIPGSSSGANADDIIYSSLQDMIDLSDLENIKFVKSDRSDYTVFNYRGWKGYLTHGENRSNHIGTSSPQSDWLAIKDMLGFDAAWRGHYHNQKRENVNGAPVFMTNSRKPGDDYTDKIATFGVTGNAIYFASDDEPVEEVITETDVL